MVYAGVVRIMYKPVDEDGFDRVALAPDAVAFCFLVKLERRERTMYAPDEEIEGVAEITGGAVRIRELILRRRSGLSTSSLQAVRLGTIRDHIAEDVERYRLLDQLGPPVKTDSRSWILPEDAGRPAAKRC